MAVFGLAVLVAPAMADDLVVWNPGSRVEQAAFAKLVAIYNAKKGTAGPHVTVVDVPFEGFADRIAAVGPRRQGPDLFIYPQDRLGGWVQAGNTVAPIDAFVDTATRERFIPATLQAMTYGGSIYGLPLSYKVITLLYNKKLVRSPPKTTADLASLAKRLNDPSAGIYGFAYAYTDFYYHAALQNGFGGRVFDQNMLPVLDSVENVRAMDLLLRWKDELLPEITLTKSQLHSLFNEGKVAMIFEGPWFLGEIPGSIDYGIAQLPAISEANNQPMRPWVTVDGLFIAATSSHKEEAYDFAKYATDYDAAKLMAIEGAQLPSNQRVYLDPALAGREVLGAFFQQVCVAVPMPNVAEMTVMWTPATVALASIVRRDATPRAALTKAQVQVSQGVSFLRDPRPPPPPSSRP